MQKHILQVGMVPKTCGGTEVFIMNIFRNINRDLIQFDFLVYDTKDELYFEKEINELGGTVYRKFYSALRHPIKRQIELYKLFAEHSEIVGVHFNATALFYIDVLLWAWIFKRPVRILHSHNTGYDSENYNLLLNIKHIINKKIVGLFCTDFFACSEAAGKWMFGDKKFKVVPNAIDLHKYKFDNIIRIEYRKELNIGENDICIGFVGRMAYQKNPEFAIELMNTIINKYKRGNIVLIMVGNGDDMDTIVEKIDEYNLINNVRVLGNRSDVNLILNAMDLYLFPSRYEGFGLSLLEAEANGVPCLISDNIPNEAIINNNIIVRSLNDDLEMWMNDIYRLYKYGRIDSTHKLISLGYDIKSMADDISKIYLKIN